MRFEDGRRSPADALDVTQTGDDFIIPRTPVRWRDSRIYFTPPGFSSIITRA